MKQPAPVYQRIAGHQWRHIWLSGDIHGCLEQLRRKLCIVVLIRGEIYLSQWETLSIVGRKVYVVCSYWNNIGFVR
ncbi:serine/threonine protein phosphatase 1 [Escherichia coli]|uniref:Serine/threonine protein phosphatase 1 n=1 Tax=Escherichia coli TaxID=562 RepID=A0A376X283_ECOLX|nr:serine/threonine protein phosphatase 1 [Escherichia coli]